MGAIRADLPTVSASLVQGGYQGFGILDADPEFIDPAGADGIFGTEDDDLRLSPISPARDAADLAALPSDVSDIDGDGDTSELIPIDRDRAIRVSGSGLDLGPYEASGLCQPGTFSVTGQDPCDPFPAGQFQPNEGGTACSPCAPGTFAAATGSAVCSPCPTEEFQPSTGAVACISCDCTDGNLCTTDACDAVSGSCENEPIPSCAIPAASTWSLICFALLLACAASIRISRVSPPSR